MMLRCTANLYIPLTYTARRRGFSLMEVAMVRITLFKSTRSQAVRLPKEVAFPEAVREVTVLRDGKRRVVVPADAVG